MQSLHVAGTDDLNFSWEYLTLTLNWRVIVFAAAGEIEKMGALRRMLLFFFIISSDFLIPATLQFSGKVIVEFCFFLLGVKVKWDSIRLILAYERLCSGVVDVEDGGRLKCVGNYILDREPFEYNLAQKSKLCLHRNLCVFRTHANISPLSLKHHLFII